MDREEVAAKMRAEDRRYANECAPQMAAGCETGPVSQDAWMQGEIDRWFTYRAPTESQLVAMNNVRQAAKVLALTIAGNVRPGAGQSQALEAVRVAVLFASGGITG